MIIDGKCLNRPLVGPISDKQNIQTRSQKKPIKCVSRNIKPGYSFKHTAQNGGRTENSLEHSSILQHL